MNKYLVFYKVMRNTRFAGGGLIDKTAVVKDLEEATKLPNIIHVHPITIGEEIDKKELVEANESRLEKMRFRLSPSKTLDDIFNELGR